MLAFAGLFAVALGRAAWIQVDRRRRLRGDGLEAAAGDDRDTRRTRHDLRPHGRAARDRRARDDRLRRSAPHRLAEDGGDQGRARRSASTRTPSSPGSPTARSSSSSSTARPTRRRPSALQRLGIPGIGFYPEERRTYPQGRVAAQLLGFAGTDNRGLDGLEGSLDKKLAGTAGLRDRRARPGGSGDRRRHLAQGAAGEERRADPRPPAAGDRRAAAGDRPCTAGARRARPRS